MTTNCPNCGAPIDRSRDSCEYCGTPYPWKPETAKLYADNQLVMEVQIEANKNSDKLIKELIDRNRLLLKAYRSVTAWQPTPEEERKMIEDMRNVAAPTVFPKVEEQVNLIDKLKYERKKELLHDILGVLVLLGPAIIAGVITWFLIH